MYKERPARMLPFVIILIFGAFTINARYQGDSILTHSQVSEKPTYETKPTPEVLTASGLSISR